MRCEVLYTRTDVDGRAKKALQDLKNTVSDEISGVSVIDVYVFSQPETVYSSLIPVLYDPVAQTIHINRFSAEDNDSWDYLVEITYKPGVTDPVYFTLKKLISRFAEKGLEGSFQTARQYLISLSGDESDMGKRLKTFLHNPLIQDAVLISRDLWRKGERPPLLYPSVKTGRPADIETFPIAEMDLRDLEKLSRRRLLALNKEEMAAIRNYFAREETINSRKSRGLRKDITDVELEMIAQTWSEHCKHKILNATITYRDGEKTETIQSLFKTYIAATTEELNREKDFLCSVFHDNSGVIRFDEETCVCFKVETHNSPSALDPYGGAITGIVGVNRDILGTGKGARPIFNTDVLCFGYPDTPESELPGGLLHPARVLSGVHRGIVDGGNQSGIPVVAGAFLFDESYRGKPLVFCGTGGILPAAIRGEESWIKHIDPGDLAVMVGGRIGKDGIHGATFSSLELSESSPTSAVQIGDPITQKKMIDFLLEARDLGLYKGITDNGAGGLSSSLGEMAEYSNGIRIDLDECPLKYEGLAPWEILVSESQERMSLAVPRDMIDGFLSLARRRDVEASVVGEFTDSGNIEVRFEGKTAGLLPIDFLHHGLPTMELEAVWKAPERPATHPLQENPDREMILAVLADPNVGSKESLIRQYDHEVQGRSAEKPFTGIHADAPTDGGLLKIHPQDNRGLTVTCGICPRYGDLDTYNMAACAVDEAFRAHIALGGNPDRAAALDNFCWPDSVQSDQVPDGSYKLAQLVRACRGLQDACLAYGIPLISGKDSMKNDAVTEKGRISVRPTLLVSLIGFSDDVSRSVSSDFKEPGDLLYILGISRRELGGSALERILATPLEGCPSVRFEEALRLYRATASCMEAGLIRSCHDLSDGGLAAALAESCLGGRMGARIDTSLIPAEGTLTSTEGLFSETPSRFLISIKETDEESLENRLRGCFFGKIGYTTDEGRLEINTGSGGPLHIPLSELSTAWKRYFGMREE